MRIIKLGLCCWVAFGCQQTVTTADVALSPEASSLEPLCSRPMERVSNRRCAAIRPPTGEIGIELAPIFQDTRFDFPVGIAPLPNDPRTVIVAQLGGGLFSVAREDGAMSPWLLVTDVPAATNPAARALWVFSFAFDPTGTYVYLYYLAEFLPGGNYPFDRLCVLSRFPLVGGHPIASGEEILLTLQGPSSDPTQRGAFSDHPGSLIGFGPDGFLYLATGDSGVFPVNEAEWLRNPAGKLDSLLGKVLRLDVSGSDPTSGRPYRIPLDNPFAWSPDCAVACPEIYAWGFRHPWRGSFDRETNRLLIGDVGWSSYEELDDVELGGDYGWPTFEGNTCVSTANDCETRAGLPPLLSIPRSDGASVTGGFVYRGTAIDALRGQYVYADWVTGEIRALLPDGDGVLQPTVLLSSGLPIAAFSEDDDGELFVLVVTNGAGVDGIYKLAPRSSAPEPPRIPELLSETGCFEAGTSEPQAAEGVVPYEIRSPLWSDGAGKGRWFAIPDGTTLWAGPDGDLQLPIGSVVAKSFARDGATLEVRLLMRGPNGGWAGYSYEWDPILGDGVLLPGAKEVETANGGTWMYPSRGECLRCHTRAAGRTLGLELAQLNRPIADPETNCGERSQLGALAPYFSVKPVAPATLSAPDDPAASLDMRARSYLHANCSGCHRPGGPTTVDLDFRFGTSLRETRACDVAAAGDAQHVRLKPGVPGESALWLRMQATDSSRMPPLGTSVVDTAGVELIAEWLSSLEACD